MAADDDKKLILARRAKFVAAALAGVAVACGKEPAPPPEPCLSVPMDNRDAEPPEPPPQPCLTPMPWDAGAPETDAIDGGGAKDGGLTTRSQQQGDAGAPPPKPTPCLSPPIPTNTGTSKPMPCLTPVRPPDKGTTR
jgi:hypothetical protein